MKVPEKLYIDLFKGEFNVSYSPVNNSVEYTRTDTFIEKALAYLNEKFYFNNVHYAVENNTYHCMEEMYEDFRKYMKGE